MECTRTSVRGGDRKRLRNHCTEIVPGFSQCAQEQADGGSQDTAPGSALPGIGRHRTGLSVLCSQPSKAVLLSVRVCRALQLTTTQACVQLCPQSAELLLCELQLSAADSSECPQLSGRLSASDHSITSTNCSLRNSHCPPCSENS